MKISGYLALSHFLLMVLLSCVPFSGLKAVNLTQSSQWFFLKQYNVHISLLEDFSAATFVLSCVPVETEVNIYIVANILNPARVSLPKLP